MVKDEIKEETKENEKQEKKFSKEISQEVLKKIFIDLLKTVGVMIYFMTLNLAYSNMNLERLVNDIKVFSAVFLVVGIAFLERAYKKDNGSIAITGIELLFLSIHSLLIMHITTLFQYDFRVYLLTSSYIISIYYVLKAIVLYTKGRKEYLNSLSDISEIVKKEEPVKKEAKKRKEDVESEGKVQQSKKSKKKGNKT